MLLSKAVQGFILSKSADGLSPNTADIYRWALDKLITFCGDKDVKRVTTDDLRRWQAWLRSDYKPKDKRPRERLALGSLQNCHTALKSFYAWASAELHIPRVDNVKRPSGESPVIRILSESEVRALLKAAETTTTKATEARRAYTQKRATGSRNVALVLLLLDTGLRIGEVARLRIGDVSLQKSGAVIVAPFGSGRKSKPRVVYLGVVARRALWRYLAERDDSLDNDAPLFTTDEGKPLSRDRLVQLVRRIGARAGVRWCHPHVLRHTFATEFLRNGGNVFALQQALGHSDLATTRRYITLAQGDVESAFRRASPADRWRL